MMQHSSLIAAVALLLAACSPPPEKPPADAGNNGGFDLGTEPDMGADGGTTPVEGTTFRMVNSSGAVLFAYTAVGAEPVCSSGAWLQILESDSSQRLRSDCTRCACDDEDCIVCAIDCAPGIDSDLALLTPGETRTFDWDGLFRVDGTRDDGDTCETTAAPTAETLTARFCWANQYVPTQDRWGDLAGINCDEVTFSPGDEVVEFEIGNDVSGEDPVTLELVNSSGVTLYAEKAPDSVCNSGGFFSLHDGMSVIRPTSPCGTCSCEDVAEDPNCQEPCPGIPCEAPTEEYFRFEDGTSRTFAWDRTYYVESDVDGVVCEQRKAAATNEMSVEFCWSDALVDEGTRLDTLTCETVSFDPYAYDSQPVRYEITSAP